MKREVPPRRAGAGRPSLIRGLSGVLLVAAVMNFLFVFLDYESDGAGLSYVELSQPPTGADGGTSTSSKKASYVADSHRTDDPTEALKAKATIAYAISATSCSSVSDKLLQGAAVLGHSVHMSSIRNPTSGSRYDYHLVAFVHPQAKACSDAFEKLGYEVQMRDTPINVSDIRNEEYRKNVAKQSCCGEKEFIKLYSYTLSDYPVCVHLDMDSVVLKPFDDLFDSMIDGPSSPARKRIPTMPRSPMPASIEAFWTRDYNMANLGHRYPGMQGGFLVIKPNIQYFEEYRQLILEGNFQAGAGWNGTFGGYFGAKQIQGLCSFFFDGVHPNTAVELNRCYYNQMADNPRRERRKDKKLMCLDGRKDCEDCRVTDVKKVVSAHFTSCCGKPWDCLQKSKSPNGQLCNDLRREWFSIRKSLEYSGRIRGHIPNNGTGTFLPETYLGYCSGSFGLIPFKI